MMLSASHALAESANQREAFVKGAFILNFSQYIIPKTPQKNNLVCFIGKGDIAISATEIQKKKKYLFDDTELVIKEPNDPLNTCNIIFIGHSRAGNMQNVLYKAKQIGAVTISDLKGFIGRGGAIEFVHVENRLGFTIALRNIDRSKVHVSAKLIEIAEEVTY